MMDPALGRLFPGFEDLRIQVPDRLDDPAADSPQMLSIPVLRAGQGPAAVAAPWASANSGALASGGPKAGSALHRHRDGSARLWRCR